MSVAVEDFEAHFNFEDAPMVDDLLFDEAIGRAASDALDTEAFTAITNSFQAAQERGDLGRIQRMAMLLGATACMHNHLQEFSESITTNYLEQFEQGFQPGSHDRHNHGDEEEDEDDGGWSWLLGKKRRKVKKRPLLKK